MLIYVPSNSFFHISCTITYYDGLIHLYKYNQYSETSDRFYNLSKEQKIESDFTPFEINLYTYKPEVYKIVFENYFVSWINGKDYKFKSITLQLSHNMSLVDNHRFDLKYKLDNFKDNILNKITEFVFNKFENFLGKELEKYSKKAMAFNLLNFYEYYLIEGLLDSKKSKDKENLKKQIIDEKDSLDEEAIRSKKFKIDNFINSSTKGKRGFKIDKLASIDVIVRNYIKNIFIRVNTNATEINDTEFINEIKKFEDNNDQYIFLNYFYLKQNKDYSLGNLFEAATKNNSNIIFMKFPLAESGLIYYLYSLYVESEKIPERIIYFHFDKSVDKYSYSFYSNGDIISDNAIFDEKEVSYKTIIKRVIDTVNFKESSIKKIQEEKKKVDSSEEESSDSEEEEEKVVRLKSWKIVCTMTGSENFEKEAKDHIKLSIKEINKDYVSEGKTTKLKRVKAVFKNIDFVEEMTSFMHCFELH